jgi:hypothetical protein
MSHDRFLRNSLQFTHHHWYWGFREIKAYFSNQRYITLSIINILTKKFRNRRNHKNFKEQRKKSTEQPLLGHTVSLILLQNYVET